MQREYITHKEWKKQFKNCKNKVRIRKEHDYGDKPKAGNTFCLLGWLTGRRCTYTFCCQLEECLQEVIKENKDERTERHV